MANQRTTFAKRQREQNRADKLKAKQARLAARRAGGSPETKGPPIAWGEAVQVTDSDVPGGVTTNDDTLDDGADPADETQTD